MRGKRTRAGISRSQDLSLMRGGATPSRQTGTLFVTGKGKSRRTLRNLGEGAYNFEERKATERGPLSVEVARKGGGFPFWGEGGARDSGALSYADGKESIVPVRG